MDGNVGDSENCTGEEDAHGEVRRQKGHEEIAPEDGTEEECVRENEGKVATQHNDHGDEDGRYVDEVHQ